MGVAAQSFSFLFFNRGFDSTEIYSKSGEGFLSNPSSIHIIIRTKTSNNFQVCYKLNATFYSIFEPSIIYKDWGRAVDPRHCKIHQLNPKYWNTKTCAITRLQQGFIIKK